MVHQTTLVCAALVLAGCAKQSESAQENVQSEKTIASANVSSYQTLTVDALHQFTGTNSPTVFQIGASPGIRIDGSQFQFTYGTSSIAPNMVQLVVEKVEAYKLSKPADTNFYVFDRSSAESVKGDRFPGFRPGDRGLIMIGRSTIAASKESVYVSWVGKFKVK